MRAALGLVAVCAAALSSCSSSGTATPTARDSTQTRTITRTVTATPTYLPPPARTVAPQPPGSTLPRGEVERACPYIASTPQQDPKRNVADIEGDHVYRTTVLTGLTPVGCRFYFYAEPYEAIADIVPRTFDSAVAAHNAMVLTAQRTGSEASGRPDIVPGVDAVLFRTTFFGPDGARDWACAFAKGKVMVVVHTQRTDQSVSALELARAIASRF